MGKSTFVKLKLKLGYSLFAVCNTGFSLYSSYKTVSFFVSNTISIISLIVIAMIFIPITFVLPYFDYLADFTATICGVNIESVDNMSYGERTLYLSFGIYMFVAKIVGFVSAILTFISSIIISFAIWLVSGSLYGEGIDGFVSSVINSYEISKFAVKIYNFFDSIAETILGKIVELEKKIYEFITRHRQIEPEINNIPPVKKREKQENIIYQDNIEEAERGNTKAQVKVGEYLICYGRIKEGLQWLKKAYLQNESTAYTAYGNLYMNGLVYKRNEGKAVKLYKLGIRGRDPSAMYFLAMYYLEKDQLEVSMDTILKLLITAAHMGEEMSLVELGRLYFEGTHIERDERKAFYWLNKAVMDSQEYAYAGYYLGRCYLEGIGVEKDEKKGVRILENSVEAGCSKIDKARELLVECYENGVGVKRNRRKAQEYRTAKNKSEKLFDDLALDLMQKEGTSGI